MHLAHWRQDLNSDAELARRAQTAATEAQGLAACSECGQPAVVYLRIEAMRFRAALCDPCCTFRLQFAAIGKAAVQLDGVNGAPVVTTIEGIDLAQFVVETLDGAIHDLPIQAAPTAPQATALTITVLEARLHRTLLPSERVAVQHAATAEATRRYHQRRADLVETQQRLVVMPGTRMFVSRSA